MPKNYPNSFRWISTELVEVNDAPGHNPIRVLICSIEIINSIWRLKIPIVRITSLKNSSLMDYRK